jgi:hypothetical protein
VYNAETLVRNAYRLMDAAQPAARALMAASRLLKWNAPTATLLAFMVQQTIQHNNQNNTH